MRIYHHISLHPSPIPRGEGELFAARLNFVNQSQFVSHSIFQETFGCCSLSPRERARVRGNETFN